MMSEDRSFLFYPNQEGIPLRNPLKGLSRNDPCFCGSGKKYKKCCLPKLEKSPEPSQESSSEDTKRDADLESPAP